MNRFKKSTELDDYFEIAKLQVNAGFYDEAIEMCIALISDLEEMREEAVKK